MKSVLKASVFAVATAIAGIASATPITFTNTSVGGSNTFTFDEMVISTLSPSNITVIDDGDGVLDVLGSPAAVGLSGDTFIETGAVYSFGFKNAGAPVFGTGLGTAFEMFAVYTPPSGSLTGKVGQFAGSAIVGFGPASSFTLYYDATVNGVLDGTALSVGTGDNASGNCVLPGFGVAQGSCELDFDFHAVAGFFFFGAQDLSTASQVGINLDLNVDELTPPLNPIFTGPTQELTESHDGSARLTVPEPGSLALVGLGLLGALGISRRKFK